MSKAKKPRPPVLPVPRFRPPEGQWGWLVAEPPTRTVAAIVRDLPETIRKAKDEAAEKAACEQAELARDALAKKVADEHVSFDAAVDAEAKRLGRKLSISKEFVRDVTRGLKKQDIIAGKSFWKP